MNLVEIEPSQRPLVIAQLVETENPEAGIKALQVYASQQGDRALTEVLRDLRSVDVAAMATVEDATLGSIIGSTISPRDVPAMLFELMRLADFQEGSVMASLLHKQPEERQEAVINAIVEADWGPVFLNYLLIVDLGFTLAAKQDVSELPEDEWVVLLEACQLSQQCIDTVLIPLEAVIDKATVDERVSLQAKYYRELQMLVQPGVTDSALNLDDDAFQPL